MLVLIMCNSGMYVESSGVRLLRMCNSHCLNSTLPQQHGRKRGHAASAHRGS
jgi:hypothetical protein